MRRDCYQRHDESTHKDLPVLESYPANTRLTLAQIAAPFFPIPAQNFFILRNPLSEAA
jgi:hypothetical protein